MNDLHLIKRHVDTHGFGSAIVGDHVAIDVVWTMKTLDGRERKREIIERAYSMEDAFGIIGSRCENRASAA